jgi:membrane-associated PAP2 superfamily phosphatase
MRIKNTTINFKYSGKHSCYKGDLYIQSNHWIAQLLFNPTKKDICPRHNWIAYSLHHNYEKVIANF